MQSVSRRNPLAAKVHSGGEKWPFGAVLFLNDATKVAKLSSLSLMIFKVIFLAFMIYSSSSLGGVSYVPEVTIPQTLLFNLGPKIKEKN
jgi:hypothetical protein